MFAKLAIVLFWISLVSPFNKLKGTENAYKILYKMTYRLDSTSSEILHEDTELLINDGQSMFKLSKQAHIDSAKILGHDYDIRLYQTTQQYWVIKNLKLGELCFYEKYSNLHGDIFKYSEKSSMQDWMIKNDTMTVHGLFCQKAHLNYGNRNWEVWFCPDIPIPEGPYKFCGLPGLIVQIEDSTASWRFDLLQIIQIAPKDFINFYQPLLSWAKPIGKSAFYAQKRLFLDNRAEISEAEGLVSFPNNTIRKAYYTRSKQIAAKNNNWIELYP